MIVWLYTQFFSHNPLFRSLQTSEVNVPLLLIFYGTKENTLITFNCLGEDTSSSDLLFINYWLRALYAFTTT